MYKEHPEFHPPSTDAILWRYTDFTKFVSLLDNEALFFSRLDKLGDPFEGSVSKINQILRPQWLHDGGVSPEQIPEKIESFSKGKREHISRLLVNCWHENDSESEAMWKLYGGDSGIAVKTTFKGLSECFRCDPDVFIGRIKYIDYNTTPVSESNLFAALLNKRKSFEHEREVRVVSSEMIHEFAFGRYLEIDVSSLIHEVIVAPYSPKWFVNLVKSVAARYDLNALVSKSEMDTNPIW